MIHCSVDLPRDRLPRSLQISRSTDIQLMASSGPCFSGLATNSYEVTLGDPGQTTTVILDTGSFELWVDPDCSRASRTGNVSSTQNSDVTAVDGILADPNYCKQVGRYDPHASSASTDMKSRIPGRTLSYGDFTSVTINYYQDTLSLAGAFDEYELIHD